MALSQCAVVAQRYARDLDEAQDDARAAIGDAREAQRRIDRAQAQIAEARDAGAAAGLREAGARAQVLVSGLTGTPNAGAAADLDSARADADAAAAREAGARRELEGAEEDLRAAQKRGERAEQAAEDAARAAAGAFGGLASASPAAVHAGQVAQAREAQAARAKAEAEEDDGGGLLGKIVHGGLDVAGLVPVIGEPADLANAGIYALEGDEVNAGLSAASALPIAGYGATAIKAGKYADEAIEGADAATDAYKAEWLRRLDEGNAFNRERAPFYENNELFVRQPTGDGYYRVDSYNPGSDIVSRKNTQLGEVQDETTIRYLREFDAKYAPGTRVADVPSTPPELRGTPLDGDMFLEVPVQTKAIPPRALELADELGIRIRDVTGHVYNPPRG